MDIEQKIKAELIRSAARSFDEAMKTARPIWEVMGMTEETYFDLYMKQDSPREEPEDK